MDDFEEKLNAILSSPETMGQIMALADSLTGSSGPGQEEPAPLAPSKEPLPSAHTAEGGGGTLPDLSGLASALSGGNNPLSLLQTLDPAMLRAVGTLFQEYNRSDDEKATLLHALRPFLRPERWAKVEKAIQITRLSRVIRAAMRLFREKGYV